MEDFNTGTPVFFYLEGATRPSEIASVIWDRYLSQARDARLEDKEAVVTDVAGLYLDVNVAGTTYTFPKAFFVKKQA